MGSKRGVPPREALSIQNLVLRGVPEEYVEATINCYEQDKDKKEFFRRYLAKLHLMYEDRTNVLMYGCNGSGKSFIASMIVKEAYRLRYTSEMITLAKLLDLTFKANKSIKDDERLTRIKNADFLVIDEVGKENFTKSGSNINLLEETLRNAVVKSQVVILISNLPLDGEGGLYEQYGASIKSLINGSFAKLKFNDSDYRPNVLNEKKSIKYLMGDDEELWRDDE